MMPGVVAGFPRKTEAPGEYLITVGYMGDRIKGYSGYLGDYSEGPYGSVSPPKPNADPSTAGGVMGFGEIMAICYEVGALIILVRGVTNASQLGFSTIMLGSTELEMRYMVFDDRGDYGLFRLYNHPDVFDAPTLKIKLIP